MAKTLNTAATSEEAAVEKVVPTTETPSTEETPSNEEMEKVIFLLSPTGKFGLGYNPGEEASLLKLQAEELIEAGYAELVK